MDPSAAAATLPGAADRRNMVTRYLVQTRTGIKEKTMKRFALFWLVLMAFALALAACAGSTDQEPAAADGDGPIVTVYSAPT